MQKIVIDSYDLYQKNSKKIVKIWQEDFTNIKTDTVVEKK